jgi:hypothetical protein
MIIRRVFTSAVATSLFLVRMVLLGVMMLLQLALGGAEVPS